MIFTPAEALAIFNSISFDGKTNMQGQPQQKLFPLTMQKDAASLAKELQTKCFDEVSGNSIKFKEGDMDLSLDERKLLKTCLERDWTANELANVLSVKDKLEVSTKDKAEVKTT